MLIDFMSGWDWTNVADGRKVWPDGTGAGETILAGGEDGRGQGLRLPDPGGGQRLTKASLTKLATRYVGLWWRPAAIPAGPGNMTDLIDLGNVLGNHRVFLGDNARLQIQSAVSGTTPIIAGTWYHVGLEVLSAAVGYRKLYLNGSLEAQQLALDTRFGGHAWTDVVAMGDNDGTVGSVVQDYDHLYSGDTNLGVQRIFTRRPLANGTHAEWAPSAGTNWQNVDEVGSDVGATYNAAGAAGQRDTYLGAAVPLAASVVNCVHPIHMARKADANPRTIGTLIRSGGGDYVGVQQALTSGFLPVEDFYPSNPAGGAWSPGNVNAAEFGLQSG